jgi:hypothetical protein
VVVRQQKKVKVFIATKTNWFKLVFVARHQPKPTKPTTTTMSKAYTADKASHITKRQSRAMVANDLKKEIKEGSVIHYLGGTSTQTPFENKFKGKQTFVRYEMMRAITPNGYNQVRFDQTGDAILPEKGENGYFVNDNFFDSFFAVNQKIKGNELHLWLDFCGMPKSDLLDPIYYSFLHEDSVDFKTLYITFFLNPRNCKEVKNLYNGVKGSKDRANIIIKKLQSMAGDDNFSFEVFDIYNNGKSPMAVLKIERREKINDMSQKASVENYVNLHKRGFSNKQIAIFWRAGIMQVAGYAASAKRMKMI